MIKPTIGRIVWFHLAVDPNVDENENTLAAIIVKVHSDELVNLAVFNGDGDTFPFGDIPLLQDNAARPSTAYCEWMPYQLGQAAKAEAAEAQLENIISGAPIT